MPPIGQLRERLELQSATDTLDSYGQPARAWTTYATVWANVVPSGGSEPVIADQQSPQRNFKITVRFLSGVSSTHRAVMGSRAFNFVSVIDLEERSKWLEIQATEQA
jgi:SPP1 family predicted phage head-tail adaptor